MYTDHKIKTYAAFRPDFPTGVHTVLTTGCWDAFHVGHLEHLEKCRLHGDPLIVCVGNDPTVRSLKGGGRPIIPAKQRARILAALSVVDIVIISEEYGRLDFRRLLERIRPRKLVISENDPAEAEKCQLCEGLGVELVVSERNAPETAPDGISTTQIVSQIYSGLGR
jgi:D-beta-D-heptose 7-phosphate kinase/D-beta-D-heptose 1-phosphate adenosyltransferase